MAFDIQIDGLVKTFGDVIAVNDLDLQIKRSEVFCLVGPNAAGKTTTIRLLLGILKA
ncbi:MAG: ATP-binding cassette domain-containing protein, partial [Promethearchaeota archaeon]